MMIGVIAFIILFFSMIAFDKAELIEDKDDRRGCKVVTAVFAIIALIVFVMACL